jgi:hypothetical protein
MSPAELYDRDVYEWAQRNAELLRSGRVSEADLAHIAQAIEDMGNNRKHELKSRLARLILHLLKWQEQPAKRGRSWRVTIANQRVEIDGLLSENPSFRASLKATVAGAYPNAVKVAVLETGTPKTQFPRSCPFTLAQLLDDEFLP